MRFLSSFYYGSRLHGLIVLIELLRLRALDLGGSCRWRYSLLYALLVIGRTRFPLLSALDFEGGRTGESSRGSGSTDSEGSFGSRLRTREC